MQPLNYILTNQALTLFANNTVYTLHADDTRFDAAVEALRAGDWDAVIELSKPVEAVRRYVSHNQRLAVVDNTVLFDGEEIHTYTAQRLLDMLGEGLPLEPLVNFMTRLADNPSKRAVDGLLEFLEYGQLPITPDGCFLAYKKVSKDYKDWYSGTIDNSVGQTIEMPRNAVQDDPSITCSYGLHFCSLDYLRSFSGAHIMVLKIDPVDVVSIPTDYNNTKGRCCKYTVVGELETLPEEKNFWNTSVVDEYDEEDGFEFIIEDDDEDELFDNPLRNWE